MAWIQTSESNDISTIVENRTGMNINELLDDKKVYHYNNLEQAVDLYLDHVKKGHKIGGFFDYDTDGVTSNNIQKLLAKALRVTNFKDIVPRRFSDGYGIKERHISEFKGYRLLILCDNGIAAVEAVQKARDMGIDVIILDHHEPRVSEDQQVLIPNANVIVDPHITGGDFDDLCGAGISYRFAEMVINKCNWMSEKQKWFFLSRMSCFAALGTVGDVVKLTYDNRKIVKEGLKNINKGYMTTGLKALCNEAKATSVSSITLGFLLSPIINASGRMADNGPREIANLIAVDAKNDKVDQAFLLRCHKAVETNKSRKAIEALAVERAFSKIETSNIVHDNFIVIVDKEITTGIAGLISGKITEKYNRPSIVLSVLGDTGLLKGSGRSVEGTNLKGILDENNSLIETYGGHPAACGITLRQEKLEDFIKAVNKTAPQFKLLEDDFYDVECTIENAYKSYVEIKKFEPYGQGNPEIKVCIKGISPDYEHNKFAVSFLGSEKQHLKIIADGIELLWFNHAKDYIEMGKPEKFDVIGSLGINSFNGVNTLQMTIKVMRLAI